MSYVKNLVRNVTFSFFAYFIDRKVLILRRDGRDTAHARPLMRASMALAKSQHCQTKRM